MKVICDLLVICQRWRRGVGDMPVATTLDFSYLLIICCRWRRGVRDMPVTMTLDFRVRPIVLEDKNIFGAFFKEKSKLTESSLELVVEGGSTLLVRLARLALVTTSQEENYRIKSMTIEN